MAEKKEISAQDLTNMIDEITNLFEGDPRYQQTRELLSRRRDPLYRDLGNKIGRGIDVGMSAIGFGEGFGQRQRAIDQYNRAVRPDIPSAYRPNEELGRALGYAEEMYQSPERQGYLEPYKQQMREGFATAADQARTLSGGQSGAAAGNLQALYNQRLKQQAQLPAMSAQVRNQALGTLGELSSQRSREDSYGMMNDLSRANLIADIYNTDIGRADALYASGSQNMFGGLAGMAEGIAPFVQDIGYNLRNRTGIPDLDEQMDRVVPSMNKRFTPAPDQIPYSNFV